MGGYGQDYLGAAGPVFLSVNGIVDLEPPEERVSLTVAEHAKVVSGDRYTPSPVLTEARIRRLTCFHRNGLKLRISSGHHMAEEAPGAVAAALADFLTG